MPVAEIVRHRIPEAEIVRANVETAVRSFHATPRFPKLRDMFGDVRVITSFSHMDPDVPSWQLRGQRVLFEFAQGLSDAGFVTLRGDPSVDHGAVAFQSPQVINLAYDNGKPASLKGGDQPGYHKIALGPFPTVLNGNQPYSVQKLSKTIDFKHVRNVARADLEVGVSQATGSDDAVMTAQYRIEDVINLFRILQPKPNGERPAAVPAIRALRSNIFAHLGIQHLSESTFSEFSVTVADVLQTLDKVYGKPFYEMPLSDEFAKGGHLKGIDSKGVRVPVDITMEIGCGNTQHPVFSYRDSRTKEVIVLKGDEIYDALRDRRVVPTVPVIILATVTAPQIAHMGGQHWFNYAPHEIYRQGEWLGLSGQEAGVLFLCTHGFDAFRIAYTDKETGETKVSKNFSMGYVTIGAEGIRNALDNDHCIQATYGELHRL